MSPATYSLLGFLPGLLPVFFYSYFIVSSDGFSPWILQQAKSTMIIPISQMRKQSLASLRTLNSPTQLIKWRHRVEAEWSHPRAQSRLSLLHPRLWTKPDKCLWSFTSTPSRENSPARPHALLEFVHSAPSVYPLTAFITYPRHQRFVFLHVSPTSLGTPGQILYALLSPSPTVAKKPGIHQVPSALRSVDFTPRFLWIPCHWKPCASLTEFRFKEELVTSFGGI